MTKAHVLITGASEGIGRELSRIFAHQGYPLILVARSKPRLDALADELYRTSGMDVITIPTDLSRPIASERLKHELDNRKIPIEILINNAGSGVHGFFPETDWAVTESMLTLNIITLTHLTRLLLPEMIGRGSGKILNVASTAAFQPGPFMACYFASKAYVLSFTEALAEELTGTGITVTAFCPGPTRTEFQKRSGTENIRENAFAMGAAPVAQEAYQGLMKGKRLVIPGFMNKAATFLVRWFPRRWVIRVARFLEEKS